MIQLSIPSMTGDHDRANVEAAIRAIPGNDVLSVDLDLRQIEVQGPATPAEVLAALDLAGHPAELR